MAREKVIIELGVLSKGSGAKVLEKSFRKLERITKRIAKAMAVGLAGIGVASVRAAASLDKSMAKIATISDVNIGKLTSDLRELSLETGVARTQLAEGYYQTVSAGIKDQTRAMEFMAKATMASIAGFAEQKQVVDFASSALKAYGLDVDEMESLLGKMFLTVKEGKTEFGFLAANMGPLLQLAPKLGITIDDLLASVAALTRIGGSTSTPMVVNQLKAAGNAVLGASPAIREFADSIDLAFNPEGIRQAGGLVPFLMKVQEATKGNEQALQKLFPNVRAIVGVFGLLNEGGKDVLDIFTKMKNESGELDEAFGKVDGADFNKLQKMLNAVKISLEDIGGPLLKGLVEGLEKLGGPDVVSSAVTAFFMSLADSLKSIAESLLAIGDNPFKFLKDGLIGGLPPGVRELVQFANKRDFIPPGFGPGPSAPQQAPRPFSGQTVQDRQARFKNIGRLEKVVEGGGGTFPEGAGLKTNVQLQESLGIQLAKGVEVTLKNIIRAAQKKFNGQAAKKELQDPVMAL